jgi:molybdate transport system substrate-binding protein
MDLKVLSGGAAKALVAAAEPRFAERTGSHIEGEFGAVGVMEERLRRGDACDVAILTATLVEALANSGQLEGESARPLGCVRTGIAVRSGDPLPDVSGRLSLAAALSAAGTIYFPDPLRATAGIHFVRVLRELGIHDAIAARLRPYPNGAAAMLALAQAAETQAIGCTQVTEILYTEGVTLVAPLPVEFELSTVYTAAVCTRAADPSLAGQLVALLSGAELSAFRAGAGFEP